MNLGSRIAAPRALVRCAVAILLGGLAGVALAQGSGAWPNRPIRIVIPYAAGSSPDVFARIVAEKIAPRLGQPVLVDNRAG
ncbi:MAG: tripartite tricarboxylate transporter substrate binding protein, partial [Caldimonas sp.]